MRVLVVVRSGPDAGRSLAVHPGETVTVGRRSPAELVLAGDPLLSGSHLEIGCDAEGCTVRDLGSTNGSFVAGRRIEEARFDEDGELQAGDTILRIRVEREPARATAPPPAPAERVRGPTVPLPPVSDPGEALDQQPCSVQDCSSGLKLVLPADGERAAPADVAAALQRVAPLHLLVDPLQAELPDDQLDGAEPLFDFLDEDVVREASPVLLPQPEHERTRTLVEKLWGSDAVVCLYCDEPPRDLLAHLRRAVRAPGPGQAVLGAYRPSLLWMLLAHDAPAHVRELLNGVVAVLVEAPAAPESPGTAWQLFVPERSLAALARAGLVVRE